jgi:hypothetical protein
LFLLSPKNHSLSLLLGIKNSSAISRTKIPSHSHTAVPCVSTVPYVFSVLHPTFVSSLFIKSSWSEPNWRRPPIYSWVTCKCSTPMSSAWVRLVFLSNKLSFQFLEIFRFQNDR